jgi:hypothetical protein
LERGLAGVEEQIDSCQLCHQAPKVTRGGRETIVSYSVPGVDYIISIDHLV